MKEQDKTPEEEPSEVQISNLPDKEFKAIVIKMLNAHIEYVLNMVRTHTLYDFSSFKFVKFCLMAPGYDLSW